MDINKLKDLIRQVYQEEFNKNYYSGNPRTPPHTHNGIDNLTLSNSGGGTPGGTNTEIQFNDNGVFGADPGLTYDKINGILGVHDINNNLQGSASGFDLSIEAVLGTTLYLTTNNIDSSGNPLGATGNIDIQSDDVDSFNTGNVNIQSGNSTTTGNSGNLNLETGNSDGNSGNVTIKTGNATADNAGNIAITSGSSVNGNAGDINIWASGSVNDLGGSIQLLTENPNAGSILLNSFSNILIDADIAGILVKTNDGVSSSPSGPITIQTGIADGSATGGAIEILTQSNNFFDNAGAIILSANNNNKSVAYAAIALTAQSGFGQIDIGARQQISIIPNTVSDQSGTAGTIFLIRNGGIGDGAGMVFLGDADQVPTVAPTNGGLLYSTGGALHWLGSSGTDTLIANS